MRWMLPGVNRLNVGRELLAGVTLIAIAIPLNIGYAQIAGLPATAGLYALVVPTLVWALLSSSRQLVVTSDAAAASLVASSIGGLAIAGSQNYATMALAQAIICGIIFLLMSVFRLGFLANFLSKPILVGFVGGLSLDIAVSQLAKMLGIRINSGAGFGEKLADLIGGIGDTNPWSLLIAGASVAILMLGPRLAPVVPWALVVMIVTTVTVSLTHASDAGVQVLGEIPAGPPTLTWPLLDWGQWLALVPSALALVMVASAEGLLVARSYAERHRYPTRPNRDLLALGAASIAAGIWQGVSLALSALADPRVLDAVSPAEGEQFDPERFIRDRGTLYLLATGVGAGNSAALVAALVEDLVETARRMAARSPGARLDPPLLFALDEIGNLAPLPSLPTLMAEGGGTGITTMPVLQSLAQARDKWSENKSAAIWDASIAKIILGGASNSRDLQDLSTLIGERDEFTDSVTLGDHGSRSNQRSIRRVPILPPDRIRTLPFGTGVILLRSAPPIITDLHPWPKRSDGQQLKADRAVVESLLERPDMP